MPRGRLPELPPPPVGTVRWLNRADFKSVMNLRLSVLRELVIDGHMVAEDDDFEFVKAGLRTTARTIGLFSEGLLVATSSLDYTDPSNDGSVWAARGLVRRWIRNSDVACLQSTIVRTDMRGQGIQRYMTDARIATATAYGYSKIWAAVAFSNIVSLQNLFACGFKIVDAVEFEGQSFGRITRFGLEWSRSDVQSNNLSFCIDLLDLEANMEAMRKGFVGVSIHQDGDVFLVGYS